MNRKNTMKKKLESRGIAITTSLGMHDKIVIDYWNAFENHKFFKCISILYGLKKGLLQNVSFRYYIFINGCSIDNIFGGKAQ